MWNWWRAGSKIPVVSRSGEVETVLVEDPDKDLSGFDLPATVEAVKFPQAADIPPAIKKAELIASGETFATTEEMADYLRLEQNNAPLTATLETVPVEEFAESGQTSKIGAFANKAAPIGKALIVLASTAVVILEAFSIVDTVALYDDYEKQIEEIATSTTKYYQDVIRAAKPPPPSPPSPP